MTETIKDTNDALNADSALTRIHFGDYEANGKQIVLVENLATNRERTHIADCNSEEIATMIVKALNLVETWALDAGPKVVHVWKRDGDTDEELHKRAMLKVFGVERD